MQASKQDPTLLQWSAKGKDNLFASAVYGDMTNGHDMAADDSLPEDERQIAVMIRDELIRLRKNTPGA